MVLTLAHLNIRSLSKNFGSFKDHIYSANYDIIAVTETWLSSSIPDSNFCLDHYCFLRKDRNSIGGGVAFYIKNNITFTKLNYEALNNNFEHLWFTIIINHKKFLIGVVYKNKYTIDFLESFEDLLSLISPQYDELVCLGDFNINLLNFDSKHIKFNSLLESYGLHQLINAPTRITKNTSSLLDLIIVSDPKIFLSHGVVDVHISDHSLIYCQLLVPVLPIMSETRIYRDFSNFNYEQFCVDIQQITWGDIFQMDNIDQKVDFLSTNISTLFNVHVPSKIRRFSKPFAPWLTDNLKLMMSLRDNALKRFRLNKKIETWNYYKRLRNYTNSAVISEKKAYLAHQARINDSKSIWKTLNYMGIYSKTRTDIPIELRDPEEINNFFSTVSKSCNVADDELINFYNNNRKVDPNLQFSFFPVTEREVESILSTINTDAVGSDGISRKFIKLCCPYLLPIFTHIFNYCLTEFVFPSAWKNSLVIPLPKINNPSEFGHLRPISILPTLSKVLEKIIYRQINDYVERMNVIPTVQSGFRARHSCSTALLNIVDDILNATDENKCTVLILLDYSKAFDTVNHQLLVSILHFFGFDENSLVLIKNFLSDRSQQVKINNSISSSNKITSGVPQGSILGPLLFNIYTSNLASSLNYCNFHVYADDTQIYYPFAINSINIAEKNINEDLARLHEFSKRHSLLLNPNKSIAMLFGPTNARKEAMQSLSLSINNVPLAFKESTKNLGLILDTDLRFRDHINNCIKKAYCNLKLLFRNRLLLTLKTKILLCNSLVLSHFNFADEIYGPCLDSVTSKRIQKTQNTCLRFIYGIRKRNRVTHKLKDVKWLNMYNRRQLHAACLFHKIIIYRTPPYLYNKITYRTDVHNINIRTRGNVTIPKHKTQLYKRCFTYQLSHIYNNIPPNIRPLSIPAFKRHFFEYLFNHQ